MKTKLSLILVSILTLATATFATSHKTVEIDGVEIFYRESGSTKNPTILLLHGYPTSSHMFRNLIPELAQSYHVLAPDYPGFGQSEQPPIEEFEYSFDNYANIVDTFLETLEVDSYSIYLMDYGAPVGFRIAAKHPERIESLIIQNGNAYDEGLEDFWDPIKTYWNDYTVENGKPLEGFHSIDGLKWQYTHGVGDAASISPDNWTIDLQHLGRPENAEIQLALFYDYRTNVPLYPAWQQYFREHQPPALIVWGKNDVIFPASGAYPYERDLKNVETHLLDTGHFALEEKGQEIAAYILKFLKKNKIK